MASTDHNGVAILEFSSPSYTTATIAASSGPFTPAYCDVLIDEEVEYVELWSAPLRRFETPVIDPLFGGSFQLGGVVSPHVLNSPGMWMQIDVPPGALPEAARISVSPLPYFAAKPSGGIDPFGNGVPYTTTLAEFQITLIRPDGTTVHAPQFATPLEIQLSPWAFVPLGDWSGASSDWIGLFRLNESFMTLEHVGSASSIDTFGKTVSISLGSFSRYVVATHQESPIPPEIVQSIRMWMYSWSCTTGETVCPGDNG